MALPVLDSTSRVAPTPRPDQAAPPAAPVEAAQPFAWRTALNYSVANLGASVVYALFNFAMHLYQATYALKHELIGLLANERSFVGAFIQPIVGRMSDRTRTRLGRRRPYFLVGIPLMCVALLILAMHPPFWIMLGVMTVAAFFLSIAWDPYMALLADLFPSDQRGRVGGLIGVGSGLGTVLLLLLAFALWELNEPWVFILTVAILLVTWGYTFLKLREPELPAEVAAPPKAASPLAYLRSLRPYPEAAKYTIAITFFWLGTGGAIPFITLFGTRARGATEQESFLLPLVATAVNALGAVPVGFLADRFGKKRVMLTALLLFGVCSLIGSQSQTLWQATIALGFIGLANAGMVQINPLLTDLVPKARTAEFIGLVSAVFSFAQPLGSMLVGGVVHLATGVVGPNDAYRWAFIAAASLVLIAAVLLQTVHPERARTDGV
jgi:MFS family permease